MREWGSWSRMLWLSIGGRGWHRGTSLETEAAGDRQAYGDVLTS